MKSKTVTVLTALLAVAVAGPPALRRFR